MQTSNPLEMFIDQLREDPLSRQMIGTLIDLLDESDRLAVEVEEIRELGKTMQKQQTDLMDSLKHEREENAAMRAFIRDHVTDEEALKKIFN